MKVCYRPLNSPRWCLDSQIQSIQSYQVLKMGDWQGALKDGYALSIMSIQAKLIEEKKGKEYFMGRRAKQFSGILSAFEWLTYAPNPFPHPPPPWFSFIPLPPLVNMFYMVSLSSFGSFSQAMLCLHFWSSWMEWKVNTNSLQLEALRVGLLHISEQGHNSPAFFRCPSALSVWHTELSLNYRASVTEKSLSGAGLRCSFYCVTSLEIALNLQIHSLVSLVNPSSSGKTWSRTRRFLPSTKTTKNREKHQHVTNNPDIPL